MADRQGARSAGLAPTDLFRLPVQPDTGRALAGAEMVGRACGLPGRPGHAPRHVLRTEDDLGRLADTTPMTRDELKDLACLGFSADLVMQSFHTAAYPKPVDVKPTTPCRSSSPPVAASRCARATA